MMTLVASFFFPFKKHKISQRERPKELSVDSTRSNGKKERKTDQDEVGEEEGETRDPKTTLFMSNKGVSDSLLL